MNINYRGTANPASVSKLPHSFRVIHVLAPDLAAETVLQWILGQTNAMYMNQFTISTILAIPPPESCHSPCNRLTSFRCFNSTLELDGSVAGTRHRGGIRRHHHTQTYHWMGYVTIETGMPWGTPFSIKIILYMLQYDYWPDTWAILTIGAFLTHALPIFLCFLSQTYFTQHLTPKIPNPPIIIPYVYLTHGKKPCLIGTSSYICTWTIFQSFPPWHHDWHGIHEFGHPIHACQLQRFLRTQKVIEAISI